MEQLVRAIRYQEPLWVKTPRATQLSLDGLSL
jgi:hypothetical protein